MMMMTTIPEEIFASGEYSTRDRGSRVSIDRERVELSEYKSTRVRSNIPHFSLAFPPSSPSSPFNHPLINHLITYNHGHITRGTRYRCQEALLLLPRQQLGGRIGRANSRGHRSRPPARSAMLAHRGQRLYVTFSGSRGIKIFGLNHTVS